MDTPRHLLDLAAIERAVLEEILRLADVPIDQLGRPLEGRGAALIFEKPSLRTRHSSELAVVQLGGHPVYTRSDEIGLDSRESVEDVARILSGYHALIAARVFDHATLDRMAAVADVPIVNLLSDRSHPLQAIADLVCMSRHVGPLASLCVAWVGDFNNVARSLAEGLALVGGRLQVAHPVGLGPTDDERMRLEKFAGVVEWHDDPVAAVTDADVVHTDTWVSMGEEQEATAKREVLKDYRVTAALMGRAAPGARFMHCMPAHRGEEVDSEVIDGPASLVLQQGRARVDAARAVFAFLGRDRAGS